MLFTRFIRQSRDTMETPIAQLTRRYPASERGGDGDGVYHERKEDEGKVNPLSVSLSLSLTLCRLLRNTELYRADRKGCRRSGQKKKKEKEEREREREGDDLTAH